MSRRTRNRKEAEQAALESAATSTVEQGRPAHRAWMVPACAAAYFAALLAFGWFTQFYSPYVREADELYHFHHALIYRLHGPWSSAFPWVTFSVISRYNSDLWYGYHLLLIPFTLGNPINGLKWGSVVITAAAAAVVWWAVRMRGAPLSFLWPTIFLFATGFGLSRFYTLRPEVVSMALTCLLLSALFADRRKMACIIGAVFAFIHLTVVWLPIMACGAAAVMSRLFDNRRRGRVIGWTCAGLAVGAVLRPNPIGAMHLLYVQTFRLAAAKMSGAVPSDAQEMLPLGALSLHVMAPMAALLIVATLWLAASKLRGAAGWRKALGDSGGYLATTGLLTVMFGVGAVVAALRCLDQFHAFGTLYLCGVVTILLAPGPQTARGSRAPLPPVARSTTAAIAQVVVAIAVAATLVSLSALNAVRGDPTEDLNTLKYYDAAAWLRHNTPTGSIVFHARWSDFPSLWFWDDHNRFIAGMDPIFSYAADPKQFQEYNAFRRDEVGYPISEPTAQESFAAYARGAAYPRDVLTDVFGARYVVVEPATQPNLASYLTGDKASAMRFDQDGIEIFELRNAR